MISISFTNGAPFKVSNFSKKALLDLLSPNSNHSSRDTSQLIALVHHVYMSIPGVVVLPYENGTTLKTSRTNLLPANVLRNYILRLGDSLEKELKFVKKYFDQHIDQVAKGTEQESPVVINEAKGYKNFRMTLAELENESDQLFDKIVVHEEEVVPEEDMLMDLN